MAMLFDDQERIVPTWLTAAKHLAATDDSGRNLVLEIPNIRTLTAEDRQVITAVNARLAAQGEGLTIETVAGTIFPQGVYRRHGRAGMYTEYQRLMARAKKGGTWGCYFDRMTQRTAPSGETVNPLESLINKLARSANPNARTWQSTYELSPSDPAQDIYIRDDGGELATYEPTSDRNRALGGPCLSHLSFKITNGTHLDLTAIYRSHYYCARALGNLLGLGRLQDFVAVESGLQIGTLTCLSTHAEMDWKAWGGARQGKALLAAL